MYVAIGIHEAETAPEFFRITTISIQLEEERKLTRELKLQLSNSEREYIFGYYNINVLMYSQFAK